MIQIQPKYSEKEQWLEYANKRTLRYEILEFSSAYLNTMISEEQYDWYASSHIADSVHGSFIDNYPVSVDDEIRRLSRDHCMESIRQAKRIGARNVVFHSTALPFVRGGLEELWARDAVEYYEPLAEENDINIFIENFSDVDYDPLRRMMDHVRGDRLKVCLDIGHANYTRHSIAQWFEALGDTIGYIHISDNDGMWDDHMVLGEGCVEFATADRFYRAKDCNIPLTIEVKTLDELDRSVKYLEKEHLFGF